MLSPQAQAFAPPISPSTAPFRTSTLLQSRFSPLFNQLRPPHSPLSLRIHFPPLRSSFAPRSQPPLRFSTPLLRPPLSTMTVDTLSALQPSTPLTIGIVGFGNFGQFLGKTFAASGHRVVGMSRGDYGTAAAQIGCEYVRDANELMDLSPDVVLFATSIMSLDKVLSHFPLHRLDGVLVVDVLSVKLYAKDLLLRCLPSDADILCTHPMFGPESGSQSWKDLPFVYDVVRMHPTRKAICEKFIDIWVGQGCRMVHMSCAKHDEFAASTQFITHTTGRMLSELKVDSTPINTRGYESLLGVVDTTCKDSFELFYGLFKYNPSARSQLDRLENALRNIREQLETKERKNEVDRKKIIAESMPFPCIASDEVLQNFIRFAR